MSAAVCLLLDHLCRCHFEPLTYLLPDVLLGQIHNTYHMDTFMHGIRSSLKDVGGQIPTFWEEASLYRQLQFVDENTGGSGN